MRMVRDETKRVCREGRHRERERERRGERGGGVEV